MRIAVLASSVLAAAFVAGSANAANESNGAANAPQQTTAQIREEAWVAQCADASEKAAKDCAVNKRVLMANTGQLLALISVRVVSERDKPIMMLQAPLGLYLPPGMSVSLDEEKPLSVPVQTCDNNGCYAGLTMSDDLLKKFRNGGKLALGFQNMNRQNIKVTVSLEGFAEAYDQMK